MNCSPQPPKQVVDLRSCEPMSARTQSCKRERDKETCKGCDGSGTTIRSTKKFYHKYGDPPSDKLYMANCMWCHGTGISDNVDWTALDELGASFLCRCDIDYSDLAPLDHEEDPDACYICDECNKMIPGY